MHKTLRAASIALVLAGLLGGCAQTKSPLAAGMDRAGQSLAAKGRSTRAADGNLVKLLVDGPAIFDSIVEDIAKAQLLAEDPTSRHKLARRSGRVQKQASHAHRLLTGELDLPRSNANALRARYGMQNDLTANAWDFKHSYDAEFNALEHLGDVPLSALYANVHNWPTGNDRLLMTQCLEFARQNPERQLDTSHWNWIITSQGLAAPPSLANGAHRDVDALQRLRQLPDPQ